MLKLLQAIYWWVCRVLLRLRYRVRVVGLEQLRDLQGPTLVMPNHPAYIDPPLVMSHLRLGRSIRPVVIESMYRRPVLYPLMRLVEALEVPDLGEHSRDAREQTLAMIDSVVAGLEPGRMVSDLSVGPGAAAAGCEEIGATGPWPTSSARCPAGQPGAGPHAGRVGQHVQLRRDRQRRRTWGDACCGAWLDGRQPVAVRPATQRDHDGRTRAPAGPARRGTGTAQSLSRSMVQRGRTGKADLCAPPLSFRSARLRIPRRGTTARRWTCAGSSRQRSPPSMKWSRSTWDAPLEEAEKQAETTLEQLGLDSLERMDIALAIEDRFGFHSDQVAAHAGRALGPGRGTGRRPGRGRSAGACRSGAKRRERGDRSWSWPRPWPRRSCAGPSCTPATWRWPTELSGVLTYRRLLVGAQLMSRRIASLPGDAVGVHAAGVGRRRRGLLRRAPGGQAAGDAELDHRTGQPGPRRADARQCRVVTSRRLIDRLGIEVKGAEYVFLEDLRGGIGKVEALATLAATYLLRRRFLRDLPRPGSGRAGGSAVHLGIGKHAQGGAAEPPQPDPQRAASLAVLCAHPRDAMLGFLPPFHSFGLMGNVIAPMLAGVARRATPDPTDAAGMVRSVAALPNDAADHHAHVPELHARRGHARRPPKRAHHRHRRREVPGSGLRPRGGMAPQVTILEGYGITECSPVVAGQPIRAGFKPGTVGQPVDGVEAARRRSRNARAVAGAGHGHAPGPRSVGLPRLPELRRARSVPAR